ncbi:MAG: lysylphosphatidylglycerol synthase transmembrane domain-containing protein [Candidatus Cloacimonetes bacterium]|nr:lysylphosphatidylglycerol synthase transmembrane domain-containing protein [Candidatus Cloacimonadota bacterium]
MKIIQKIVISLIIGTLLIILWLRYIDFAELLFYLKQINILPVIPSIFFYLMSYFIRSQRLRALLSHKTIIPVFRNYTYVLSGNFVNYLIPIRAGEVIKAYFYKKNHNIKWAESLPSIFIDKFFDTFAIFVVLLLIPFIGITLSVYLKLLLVVLVLIFILGFFILFMASLRENNRLVLVDKSKLSRVYLIMKRIFHKLLLLLPIKYKDKFYDFIKLFLEGLAIFKNHKRLFPACLVLTLLATLSDSLFFFLMFRAFNVQINFAYILFGYTLIFLSYILPHPPAQIGSNEVIMILIFAIGFGLDENLVSAVMSFSHVITALVIFITGSLSLAYAGIKLIDFIKNKEIDNE